MPRGEHQLGTLAMSFVLPTGAALLEYTREAFESADVFVVLPG